MNINQTCPLVLQDLYFYDIKSCYYQLSEAANFNLEGIDKDNKVERNIALGMEQIDNPNFQKYLQETSESIIDYYLFENRLSVDEIILKQRDGFIITRLLDDNSSVMKIDFREHVNWFIMTPDRTKYMTISDDIGVTVKGMPNQYTGIQKMYDKFKDLNFYNKKGLFRQLKSLKDGFFTSEDMDVFTIVKDGKKLIISRRHGLLEIKPGLAFSGRTVDKQKYYDLYLREFIDSLILQFY